MTGRAEGLLTLADCAGEGPGDGSWARGLGREQTRTSSLGKRQAPAVPFSAGVGTSQRRSIPLALGAAGFCSAEPQGRMQTDQAKVSWHMVPAFLEDGGE